MLVATLMANSIALAVTGGLARWRRNFSFTLIALAALGGSVLSLQPLISGRTSELTLMFNTLMLLLLVRHLAANLRRRPTAVNARSVRFTP